MSTPTCPICHQSNASAHFTTAQDIEYFTSDKSYEFYECDACKVLFLDPMPVDELSTIYPSNYYSFEGNSAGFVHKIKSFLDKRSFNSLFKNIEGESLSVLDVGGGNGWLLSQLKEVEPRVENTWVVDIDPDAQASALEAGHKYHLGIIESFDHDQKFDVIMMLNLIEHVTDPAAVLKKAAALLTPQGKIYIKTPNYDALDCRVFKKSSWAGFHTPRHFVLFTGESIQTLAKDCDLNIVDFKYTQGAPFWSVSTLNKLRKWGWVKGNKDRPLHAHPLNKLGMAFFAGFDYIRRPFSKTSQVVLTLTPKQ